ncbi:MAG: response regulator [Myxococcaceae bacterium]|nr:MAG: response regulator [Myxococcaceae bacterium]
MAGTPNRKVLVVDDDPSWRQMLSLELEELGYEPVLAADGAEALQLLEHLDCSVILLDLRMPGLDGHEVMARLPLPPEGPRVVILTAAGMDEVQEALAARPHYYLPKAAGRDELALMLQSLAA